MAKRERSPERDRLVKQIIAEYQPKSIPELQNVLKEIFASLMEGWNHEQTCETQTCALESVNSSHLRV